MFGGDELDWDIGDKGFEPARAFVHAGLFAGDVADDDEGFAFAFGSRIGYVLDGLPFASFADEKQLDVVLFEGVSFPNEACGAGT